MRGGDVGGRRDRTSSGWSVWNPAQPDEPKLDPAPDSTTILKICRSHEIRDAALFSLLTQRCLQGGSGLTLIHLNQVCGNCIILEELEKGFLAAAVQELHYFLQLFVSGFV